jgi:hypothetical protein
VETAAEVSSGWVVAAGVGFPQPAKNIPIITNKVICLCIGIPLGCEFGFRDCGPDRRLGGSKKVQIKPGSSSIFLEDGKATGAD